MGLIERFKAWRRRRYWTPERKLENLHIMVMEDNRFLAHNKVADALTTRYLAALAPDWYQRVHTDSWHFRQSIGLEPDYAFKIADAETIRQRVDAGEIPYCAGPLPEKGWD